MEKNNSENRNNSGFTLIEVLVSAALMVILASGFVGLQYILSQNQVSAWRNYQSIENANGAVSAITNQLRSAFTSEDGSYPLEKADDQNIIFYSDYDQDEIVERIRYTLSGSKLLRGVVEPTGSPYTYDLGTEKVKTITDIVRNGSNPIFYYYDVNWPEDTTNNPLPAEDRIADARMIKIILKTNPKADDSQHDFTLESDVKIRMLNQIR
jgi:prepilin-type N-terminal cleavage/methylation domain-containing protein